MPQLDFIDAATGQTHRLENPREIAPGIFAGDLPPQTLPRFGLVEFKPLPNGTYVPRLVTMERLISLTANHPDPLGIGVSSDTIHRLARAGFIEYHQISPGSIRISFASLAAHLEATKEPGFWTAERVARFRDARRTDGGAACPGRAGNSKRCPGTGH